MRLRFLAPAVISALAILPAGNALATGGGQNVTATASCASVVIDPHGNNDPDYRVFVDGTQTGSGEADGVTTVANPALAQGSHTVKVQWRNNGFQPWQTALDGSFSCDYTGPQGPEGPAGPEGPQGPTGPTGPTGPQGPEGPTGPQGPEGPQGPVGPQGPQGEQGPAGQNGQDGTNGADGADGAQGAQGIPGVSGVIVAQGAAGAPGAPGADGAPGVNGTTTVVTVEKVGEVPAGKKCRSNRVVRMHMPKAYKNGTRVLVRVGSKTSHQRVRKHRVKVDLRGKPRGIWSAVVRKRGYPSVTNLYTTCKAGNVTGFNARVPKDPQQ